MSQATCENASTDHGGLMPRRIRFDKGRNCVKCKLSPGNIVIRHAVYCKKCFTGLVTSKFRRALEPSVNANAETAKRAKLKASGSLLLGLSGGLGSSVLLEMIQRTYFADESCVNGDARGGTNHPRNANVWTSCAVCYVEVCNAFSETMDRTQEIKQTLARYPMFEFVPLRLEYAFDDSWWHTVAANDQYWPRLAIELGKDGLYTEALRCVPSRGASPVHALRTYLESLPTQTATSSAIRVLIRLLLLYTARSRRASHLLLGTSLTTLSISMISCISQGGGHSILDELQEEWLIGIPTTNARKDTVRVVRPLRDLTMKECAMFAWWTSIQIVGRDRRTRASSGILGLTKDFIVGLEKDYPSTVSTIVRTCAKLESKNTSPGYCMLCQRPIQEGLEDWKSRISIRSYCDVKFGLDLSHLPTPMALNSIDVLTAIDQYPSITKHLCYPCGVMFTSKGNRMSKNTPSSIVANAPPPLSAPLPVWVNASLGQLHKQVMVSRDGELWVREPRNEANQRNSVADFLLDA